MERNGGFATLGFLYKEALKIKGVEWKTKTPFANIRRIVQDKRFFFRIRPGLWALKTWENKLPPSLQPEQKINEQERKEFSHAYYQGLLVEIGNLKIYQTFVPYQDQNKNYLDKKLSDIITIKEFYTFGYENITQKAKTIDVSWFNSRKMPDSFFEIEHSTDFQNSLLKFLELQDFNASMFIVADEIRRREYNDKLNLTAFVPIQGRVRFLDYEKLSNWHSKVYEFASLEKEIF